jgi:hypothetical protein
MAKEIDMQPFLFSLSPLLAAIVLMVCSATAVAEESSEVTEIAGLPKRVEAAPLPVSIDTDDSFGQFRFGQPVDPSMLSDLRGGYDFAENNIDVDGTVEGNTANGVIAGANTISDGAFANANGLSTVIQNSGSNVLIQNAMIVKVDFGGAGP